MRCKYCSGEKVVKKGLRRLKSSRKQMYFCKDCSKRFSEGLSKKKYNAKLILNAVCAYNQGYNYEEVCDLICRKYRVSVGKSSISRWCEEYKLGYLNIRDKIIRRYGFNLVVGRMFKHSGLIYNFKYHKGKLKEFCRFSGVRDFVFDVSKGVDDKLFNGKSRRCSKLREDVGVNVKVYNNTRLNQVLGRALKIVKSNKQRHGVVEDFMLSCDRDTIAVEVPVWYWDKKSDTGVCGHIDILQVKNGKVWVLDYKPNAEAENVDKVVSQLYNYALGLSFRSKLSLDDVRCGWFDENKMFVFDAKEVKFGWIVLI